MAGEGSGIYSFTFLISLILTNIYRRSFDVYILFGTEISILEWDPAFFVASSWLALLDHCILLWMFSIFLLWVFIVMLVSPAIIACPFVCLLGDEVLIIVRLYFSLMHSPCVSIYHCCILINMLDRIMYVYYQFKFIINLI